MDKRIISLNKAGAKDIPDWAYAAAKTILEALKTVDPLTYSHCLRVGAYSKKLAQAMGLDEYQQKVAEFSGMLHDVGKMGIGHSIIHKPAKLTDVEYTRIMDHSVLGEKIISHLDHNDFFKDILPAVRGHHERIDGKGYPDKLTGDQIPLVARLILVVDTLDAMGEDRSYRRGMPIETIYQELVRCSGTQFDQEIVKIFLESHKYWNQEVQDQETLNKIVWNVA